MIDARNRRARATLGTVVAGAMMAALGAAPVLGHDGTKHSPAKEPATQSVPAAKPDAAGVRVKISDVGLVDRNHKPVQFASEALAGRIVAIDFIYTTCTTVCPVTSSIFAEVQDALGDRLGRDAWLISLSIDPLRDTPGRLNDAAEQFGAEPGWLWLTGEKPDVDRMLLGLGAYTPDIESHPPMILIGDAARDTWVRLYGFPSPDEIIARIDAFIEARKRKQTSMKPGG